MKVLMLSTDTSVFKENSGFRSRLIDYGGLFKELHVIVYTKQTTNNLQPIAITKNVFIYPTNTRFKSFYFFDFYRIAKLLVISRKLSVITAQDPFETGLVGYLLKKRFKLPLQLQIHTDFLSPYFWRESLKNKIRVLLAKFLVKRADGIRVVSERIKRSLISNFPACADLRFAGGFGKARASAGRQFLRPRRIRLWRIISKITVLPIFVDIEKIRNAQVKIDLHKKYPSYDFIILMASRLTREKNILMAIKAIRGLTQKVLLLIVGDGPELKNLQLITYDLQLENNVKFETWADDLASYYKTADLFLLTSNYEGYGRTAIEAAALGVPVVMTDVGLAGEVLQNGVSAKIVPVGDTDALSSAISELLTNSREREELAKGASSALAKLPQKEQYLNDYRGIMPYLRKKLCYVVPEYDPQSHTHFSYLTDFIKRLSKHFDISLIIEKGARPSEDLECRDIRVADSVSNFLRFLKIEVFLWRARLCGYKDFYVHYSFFSAYTASWITKITGGRVFYWNCGEPWKYRRFFAREIFERLTYKLVDYLVTGTEGIKKEYAKHYGLPLEKIKVMPNWLKASNFQFPISNFQKEELKRKLNIKDEKIILFVHRLSKRKGAHYLPEIAQKLNSIIPNSSFVILVIGDGPERETLNLQLRTDNLEQKVRLLGWLPNNELPAHYSITDVFIMPSEEEGFPHVLLEAMAYGVPFVANAVGGVKEIVPPSMYNYVVSQGDIDGFVSKLADLLARDKEFQLKLSGELKSWVEQFNIDTVVKKFIVTISDL